MNCSYCGKPLPGGYNPIRISERGKAFLRIYMHGECFKLACAKGSTIDTLRKYAEPQPEPEPSLPGVPVALAMFAGCCAAIILAGFLIGYLAGGL